MDHDNETKLIENYFNDSEMKSAIEIKKNNIKNESLKEYSIQFQQLKTYFNFKRKLDRFLSNNSNCIDCTKCYLIDKNQFRKWKKYVGYEEFKKLYDQFSVNRYIIDKDYKWLKPIIISNEKLFSPVFFQKDKINALSDFIIIDEKCYKLFSSEKNKADNELSQDKSFLIRCIHQKIIVELSNFIYSIIFLYNMSGNEAPNFRADKGKPKPNKKMYYELLIVIKEGVSNKENLIKDIEKKDMNHWIKETNFDINQINDNIVYNKNGIKFQIINKTLKSFQNKNYFKNGFKEREIEINNFTKKLYHQIYELN